VVEASAFTAWLCRAPKEKPAKVAGATEVDFELSR